MKLFDVYPINNIRVTKGRGSYVWDDAGTRYLDMYGGHAVISIGHTHPHWVARIESQLNQLAFYSNSVVIPLQEELAQKLATVSGKKDFQLFLCNSGAEANENALKLASFHTGRKKIIAFKKAFHGRTSLAVAATDNKSIVAPVNETGNVIFLPFNDEQALQDCFKTIGTDIAAVIVEAIQGVGGITVASEVFLRVLRKECDASGAVLIADEVQCGYGRTGDFFCMDGSGVTADIYTMAKGMGNGYPVGGLLIAPHIKPRHGMLGTTFGGAHLACAAALAVLEVIDEERLIEKAKESGQYLFEKLQDLQPLAGSRGKGLMIGFDVPEHLKDLRKNLLWNQHIFTGEAKPAVIRLLPPLNIEKVQLDEFVVALKQEIQLLSDVVPAVSGLSPVGLTR
ncbi:MAG: aminotransferase class III-fold pyridoxal phosphate-dependent enzyme [Chitinophagaceae bacterium]